MTTTGLPLILRNFCYFTKDYAPSLFSFAFIIYVCRTGDISSPVYVWIEFVLQHEAWHLVKRVSSSTSWLNNVQTLITYFSVLKSTLQCIYFNSRISWLFSICPCSLSAATPRGFQELERRSMAQSLHWPAVARGPTSVSWLASSEPTLQWSPRSARQNLAPINNNNALHWSRRNMFNSFHVFYSTMTCIPILSKYWRKRNW